MKWNNNLGAIPTDDRTFVTIKYLHTFATHFIKQ